MNCLFNTVALLILLTQVVYAQKKLPLLKANSTSISIKEGHAYYKDVWTVSPAVNPDVFVSNPFVGTKTIVFYSDIDSLSFTVKPNQQYDFIILLNGKDKAYTRISTHTKEEPSLEPKLFYTKVNPTKNATDTIPFVLGKDNGIHLKGTINGSDTLDFLFDTGAGICVITSSIINQKVNMTIDGRQENTGTDGVATVDKSSNNSITISNLKWENVPFLAINYQKPSFDAVLGWVVFEDKIVEIDYEKQVLVIHQSLPTISVQYTKLDYQLIGGIPYIKCKLWANEKEVEGWFDFDTGSNGELIIGQKFAKHNALNNVMKNIGTSKSVGSTGVVIKNNKVLLPKLKLGDYEMYQIPLAIQEQEVQGDEHNENIGNNILKRFNTIIDFKNSCIYLKPNNLFYTPIMRN